MSEIAVSYVLEKQRSAAEVLAQQLQLPLVTSAEGVEYLLRFTENHLQLEQPHTQIGAVFADFVAGKVGHRFRHGGGKGQLIAKAVGLKKGALPRVLDLTAGLGRDAFVLASLGCEVQMVERSPLVAALLRDGLERASRVDEISAVATRMTLVEQESSAYLQQLNAESAPEICYLDPMYPHSKKSALPGKEMRLFRVVVGEDLDSAELLSQARRVATKRVVVKRPRKAPVLAQLQPNFQINGKSTRYDVYLPQS